MYVLTYTIGMQLSLQGVSDFLGVKLCAGGCEPFAVDTGDQA